MREEHGLSQEAKERIKRNIDNEIERQEDKKALELDRKVRMKKECFMEVFMSKQKVKTPKVAFLCVHNSCRSQIAEALGKKLAPSVFKSYSAGTEVKDHINPDAVRLMKKIHGIDMEKTQFSKLIEDIPTPDVVILMGCNVSCPNVSGQYMENWGLDDPSGKSDEEFERTIKTIEENIERLMKRL